MKNFKQNLSYYVAGLLILFMLLCLFMAPTWTVREVTATVKDKERINTGDASFYLIYTEKETFRDADSIRFLKFNSSDLYGKLERGSTYRFTVQGYRFAYTSTYRNILKAEKVE